MDKNWIFNSKKCRMMLMKFKVFLNLHYILNLWKVQVGESPTKTFKLLLIFRPKSKRQNKMWINN